MGVFLFLSFRFFLARFDASLELQLMERGFDGLASLLASLWCRRGA